MSQQKAIGTPRHLRRLHVTTRNGTDGVFKELTEMRVRTPWVEALRKKKEEGIDPTKSSNTSATPADRDLTPKRMADSYHRVVIRFTHAGILMKRLTD